VLADVDLGSLGRDEVRGSRNSRVSDARLVEEDRPVIITAPAQGGEILRRDLISSGMEG
jgi:hypothetical protein